MRLWEEGIYGLSICVVYSKLIKKNYPFIWCLLGLISGLLTYYYYYYYYDYHHHHGHFHHYYHY